MRRANQPAAAFFLRQPSRTNPRRSVAKSGRAAGSGVATVNGSLTSMLVSAASNTGKYHKCYKRPIKRERLPLKAATRKC